jgi:two-component system LytT family sensor kinase
MWKAIRSLFSSFFGQFLFVFVVDVGLGGFTYFLLMWAGYFPESGDINSSRNGFSQVILGNALESLMSATLLSLFQLFEDRIRLVWLRYVLLNLMVFAEADVVFTLIYAADTFFWTSLLSYSFKGLAFSTNIMLATSLLYALMRKERQHRQKETQQAIAMLELKELKTKAELEALQAKINPHFLYNSLNAIASLIPEDPVKAEQMVLLLARFFRYTTNAKSQYMISLEDELEMVRTYLEVEKVRFGDRLEYHIRIQEGCLLQCLVPQFLLQPLVENAIKHGISKNTGRGVLSISIQGSVGKLQIAIADNGRSFPEKVSDGYGLRSTHDKLRLLCGPEARLEILRHPTKAVQLTLPQSLLHLEVLTPST